MSVDSPEPTFPCPSWCAGHDDAQEPHSPQWHRGVPTTFPLIERPHPMLGLWASDPLVATDFVMALEQDLRSTYVYLGSLEEGDRFFAVTVESAGRLHAVLSRLLNDALE